MQYNYKYNYQIRLTIVHLSTSSNFHFLPFFPFSSVPAPFSPFSLGYGKGMPDEAEVGEVYSGRSSSDLERYLFVSLLYTYPASSVNFMCTWNAGRGDI